MSFPCIFTCNIFLKDRHGKTRSVKILLHKQQDVQGKFWSAIFRKLYDRICDIHTEKTGYGIQALDAMTSCIANAVSGSMSHREVPGNLDIPNRHTGIYSHMPMFCVL